MTIERILTASGGSRVTGVGYAPIGGLEFESGGACEAALRAELIVVLSGGSLAGNADLRQMEDGIWQIQGDPTCKFRGNPPPDSEMMSPPDSEK
jgi:hypothetical protein